MKRKFNVVDIVLIALAIAAAVGVIALRDRSTGADTARNTVPMRYTVELSMAPADMENQLKTGTDVYRATDGTYLGKIVEVRSVPHVENEFSPLTGKIERYEYEDCLDIYVTVEADAYSTAREIVYGSVVARIGVEMGLKGKGFARNGYIVNLDPMGAAITENNEVGSGELETTYVIRFEDVRTMLLGGLHVGDRLYEEVTGALLGEVVELWTEPYRVMHYGTDGPVSAEKPDTNCVYLRVKGRAVEKADGYYLDGGTELKVGANVKVLSQYFSRTGIFYALEEIA